MTGDSSANRAAAVHLNRPAAARACSACLARGWLLVRLAGHLDLARDRTPALLGLSDPELIAAVAASRRPSIEDQLAAFDPECARRQVAAAGLDAICRCDPSYPLALRASAAPPAVLYVAGPLERALALASDGPVAIVGARRASPYGLAVAEALSSELARAGVTVVSGMARGIDGAAHRGALRAGGGTLAVLAAGAERAYPASHRALHRMILATGAIVSELPPGTATRRWMFPARNRIIAAISEMTVVVEARVGSGALLTAAAAAELGRPVGAVPGSITSPAAAGPHDLLRSGATLVTCARDVLDGVFGAGLRPPPPSERRRAAMELEPGLAGLLEALAEGHDAPAAIRRAELGIERGLAALASLELAGLVRRDPGGRYRVLP